MASSCTDGQRKIRVIFLFYDLLGRGEEVLVSVAV